MTLAIKVLTFLLLYHSAFGDESFPEEKLSLASLEKNIRIEELEPKQSKNDKRSPLELGYVSFELDHRRGRHYTIPSLIGENLIHKNVPVVSKSRIISTTSTIVQSGEKGPRNGDHVLIPLDTNHVIIPLLRKIHDIHPKVILDHKELLVDHAADIILQQKHVIVEHSHEKSHNTDQQRLILEEPNSQTVIFEHKPVIVDHNEHGTNVLIHSSGGKTMVLEEKPISRHVSHPRVNTVVLGSSRTIVISPKNKIHEIIVHRHVPKSVQINEEIDRDDRNLFRSHFGGFGVGVNYGGHGAGHGFHVPFI